MRVLDLDMDYFMDEVATNVPETTETRLPEEDYGYCVWSRERVISFLENNLGLSKDNKICGRIIKGHNEAITFWSELIEARQLTIPFKVIHVDSHADLGLGYSSSDYLKNELLAYPVEQRQEHNQYTNACGRLCKEGIGDYLLFAIAYRWISHITYCANENGAKDDYVWDILKDLDEQVVWDEPVENIIQLVYNPDMDVPKYGASQEEKRMFLDASVKEPEVPFVIIPTLDDVNYDGTFDFIVVAQSPNYTPQSADFILDILREYIEEC